METKPVIKNITIYPVKSLDGMVLQKAQIGSGGSLLHDREFAIVDANGKYVNGKRNMLVHSLRSKVDFENEVISLRHEASSTWNHFHPLENLDSINKFLSTFFNMPVTLQRDKAGKFLDEPVKSGVTVISTSSLETVGGWFNQMPVEETRKRFRANIEIDNVPSFWEDRLFSHGESAIEFRIGNIILFGMDPRARCVVPTRHPQTGEKIHLFQKSFTVLREDQLPNWSALKNYSHTYYLSVDCYIPPSEFGKWVKVGDEVKITGSRVLPAGALL